MAGTGDLLVNKSTEPSAGKGNVPHQLLGGDQRQPQLGCKETLPLSGTSGEVNPGDEHTQGVLSCLISSPSLTATWSLLSWPWLQGWGWRGRGLPALAAGGRAGRGSALKWLVITGTAGSGGSVQRLPNAAALSGAALALREMACE